MLISTEHGLNLHLTCECLNTQSPAFSIILLFCFSILYYTDAERCIATVKNALNICTWDADLKPHLKYRCLNTPNFLICIQYVLNTNYDVLILCLLLLSANPRISGKVRLRIFCGAIFKNLVVVFSMLVLYGESLAFKVKIFKLK